MCDVDDQNRVKCLKGSFKMIQKFSHSQRITQTLNFHDKFDLEGQGQGHYFQTYPKPLDDQCAVQVCRVKGHYFQTCPKPLDEQCAVQV